MSTNDAGDEIRSLVDRERPNGLTWDQLPRDVQSRLVSAAEGYATDAEPYDAARDAFRRGEREGWFRQ